MTEAEMQLLFQSMHQTYNSSSTDHNSRCSCCKMACYLACSGSHASMQVHRDWTTLCYQVVEMQCHISARIKLADWGSAALAARYHQEHERRALQDSPDPATRYASPPGFRWLYITTQLQASPSPTTSPGHWEWGPSVLLRSQ